MAFRRFRKTIVKKQRSFASKGLLVQDRRPGLERVVSQADQTRSSADGPDDDFASALSRSSSGGERMRGSTHVSKHCPHRTPGPKFQSMSRATQRSTPARP